MKTNFKYLMLLIVIVLIIAGIYFISRSSLKETNEQIQNIPPTPPPESPLSGKTLSPEKEVIRQSLVAPLGEAGTLADEPDFRIDYIAPDIFQVEIKTTFIARARDEAVQWFKDKGFSEEDICKLPVTFYPNSEVAKQLEGSGVIFKTLPDFCQ